MINLTMAAWTTELDLLCHTKRDDSVIPTVAKKTKDWGGGIKSRARKSPYLPIHTHIATTL